MLSAMEGCLKVDPIELGYLILLAACSMLLLILVLFVIFTFFISLKDKLSFRVMRFNCFSLNSHSTATSPEFTSSPEKREGVFFTETSHTSPELIRHLMNSGEVRVQNTKNTYPSKTGELVKSGELETQNRKKVN